MITRERGILITLTVLALSGTGVLARHTADAATIPPVGIHRAVTAGDDGVVTIQFLGDTMLGDGAEDTVTTDAARLTALMAGFADGDISIANAEGPITDREVRSGLGTRAYAYASQPKVAGVLAATGVDIFSLANNHSMDVGLDGLRDTQRLLADAGVLTWGAGATAAEAEVPLLLDTPNGTIGVLAVGEDFGSDRRATATTPGTIPATPQRLQRGVDLARAAGADLVVAFVHWGDNYQPVNDEQRSVARMLVDAGVNLVVGTGPHVTQPVEVIDGVPIAWSLGNFVFTTPGRFAGYSAEGYGLSLTLVIGADGSTRFDWRCLVTDNLRTDYQARPCTPSETLHVLPFLNSSLTVAGTVGTMPSPLRLKPAPAYAAPTTTSSGASP